MQIKTTFFGIPEQKKSRNNSKTQSKQSDPNELTHYKPSHLDLQCLQKADIVGHCCVLQILLRVPKDDMCLGFFSLSFDTIQNLKASTELDLMAGINQPNQVISL